MPFDNTQNDFALLEADSNNLATNIKEKDINNVSLQSIVDSYKLYYADGESHTAKAKRYDLSYFVSFIINESGRKIPLVSDWTLQITKDFIDQRLASGDSPSTVNRRLATIKHLGRTLSERIPGFVNPAREAKSPKFDSTKPQGLNSEEINFLRKIAKEKFEKDPNKFINLRNLVLLEVLLGTGLRADEVRLLKISQIKEDFSWLTNVRTKGKKFREVYLHSELSELLKSYTNSLRQYILDHFPEYNQLPSKAYLQLPVFPSVKGSKVSNPSSFTMDPKTLWRIISAFGLSASYSPDFDSVNNKFPRIHPHKLRHSFAHGLLDSSQDIRLVAQALGHSDVRTTMRYTERSKDELRNAIEISNTKSKKLR